MELLTAVDFAPNGTLYLGGVFMGFLNHPEELGAPGNKMLADPNSNRNTDYFLLQYESIDSLPQKNSDGDLIDSHTSGMYTVNQNGNEVPLRDEKLRDLEAGVDWVAFTGQACSPLYYECSQTNAFIEIFREGHMAPYDQKNQALTRRLLTSQNEGAIGWNVAVDPINTPVIWSGYNTEANHNSLGGGALPGTDFFIASYAISP